MIYVRKRLSKEGPKYRAFEDTTLSDKKKQLRDIAMVDNGRLLSMSTPSINFTLDKFQNQYC